MESRAARQIETEQRGGIDALSYFVGYFYPCIPNCQEASSRGRESLRLLNDLDPTLRELYRSLVAENLERVRDQPKP